MADQQALAQGTTAPMVPLAAWGIASGVGGALTYPHPQHLPPGPTRAMKRTASQRASNSRGSSPSRTTPPGDTFDPSLQGVDLNNAQNVPSVNVPQAQTQSQGSTFNVQQDPMDAQPSTSGLGTGAFDTSTGTPSYYQS